MIVKDEERCLERCLRAARPLVDEMIVVDTGSTDRTKEIALASGARVFDFTWVRDFSAARNFSLEQSDAEWNLVMDADEYLRPISRRKLEEEIRRADRQYGYGNWLGGLLRYDSYRDTADEALARQSGREGDTISIVTTLTPRILPRGVRYEGTIHEQVATYLPCVRLSLRADHDGYLYVNKGERNLGYIEEAAAREPENSYYWYQMGVALGSLERREESLPWYRRLWKDGDRRTGYWANGVVRYLYVLLGLGQLSCLEEAKTVMEDVEPVIGNRADYWFVCGLVYMRLVLADVQRYVGYLPRIEQSYLRCLQIGEHPEMETALGTGSFKAAYNLGVWYEVSGQAEKARQYYRQAAKEGYEPAKERLRAVTGTKS